MCPRQIYRDSRLIWRDCIATGDLPNLAMQLLARAFNVPEEITITENIPVIPVDLGDPSDVENLDEDRQSEKSDVGCVNVQQDMHESDICVPDLMEDTCKPSSMKTPISLTRWWWAGLIDEASKSV